MPYGYTWITALDVTWQSLIGWIFLDANKIRTRFSTCFNHSGKTSFWHWHFTDTKAWQYFCHSKKPTQIIYYWQRQKTDSNNILLATASDTDTFSTRLSLQLHRCKKGVMPMTKLLPRQQYRCKKLMPPSIFIASNADAKPTQKVFATAYHIFATGFYRRKSPIFL